MADFIKDDRKIPKGVRVGAEFAQVGVDMITRLPSAIETGTALGASIGSIVPGIGTAIGAFIGAWIGIIGAVLSSTVPHGIHINDILNNEDDPEHTVETAVNRPASLVETALNPAVDVNGTARKMVTTLANGGTIRGVINFYGQNMMQQALHHKNVVRMSNELGASQGMSSMTASAFADPTNRLMLAKAGGRSSSSYNTVVDGIYGNAYTTSLQMLYQKQRPEAGAM